MRGLMDSWQDWKSRKPFVLIQESRSKIFSIQTPLGQEEKKKFPLRVFSVEGVFVPYRVKVTTDEGSSVHLFPRREQEDPSIFSVTKRLGRFSKASMRETNIITSPREVQRHEKRSRGEFGSGRVFFFFFLSRGQGGVMGTVWPLALQTVVFYCF